jgi:2,5-dihydroxypyridine 5,6-dioxygenase
MPAPLEPKWIDAFEAVLRGCALQAGDTVAILHEARSRRELPDLARRAASRIGALSFGLELTSATVTHPLPSRTPGASTAIRGLAPAIAVLGGSTLVVDCTADGLMHTPELLSILKGGTRIVYLGNAHPEALVRLVPGAALEPLVKAHVRRLRGAKRMRVTSPAGTELQIDLAGSVAGGNWGTTTQPGTLTHWPGGLALVFPAAASVRGRLVLDVGDANLGFKRTVEQPIRLTIEDDHIKSIEGRGVGAELMRGSIAAWGERAAYAVSHIGYGLNDAAGSDTMAMFDKSDSNGSELRARAGNFLYSTGANEVAKRFTLGHIDLPLRNCTITLDGEVVVRAGRVVS